MGKINEMDYLKDIDSQINELEDFYSNTLPIPSELFKSITHSLKTLKNTYSNSKRTGYIVTMGVKEWRLYLELQKQLHGQNKPT